MAVQRHVNWEFAERALGSILPGSTAYSADRIVGIPARAWERFDIEGRDAGVVEEDFLGRCVGLGGLLIVVNDASFDADQGPFFVEAGHLAQFVRQFDRVTGGDFFGYPGAIVVSLATGVVVVVQEDGYIATVHGTPLGELQAPVDR